MAVKQRPPILPAVIAFLCVVLFAYVVLVPSRHDKVDRVVNPSVTRTDRQILGNTRTALPLRRPPSPLFGAPQSGSSVSVSTPALSSPASKAYIPFVSPTASTGQTSALSASQASSLSLRSHALPILAPLVDPSYSTDASLNAHSTYMVMVKPLEPGQSPRKQIIVNR